jgi:hypothetical protein
LVQAAEQASGTRSSYGGSHDCRALHDLASVIVSAIVAIWFIPFAININTNTNIDSSGRLADSWCI